MKAELPKHKDVKRLGEVCTYSKGKKPIVLKETKTKDCTVPYINIKAFEKGIISEYTNGEKCNICNDDDLLMVWDGARCGLIGKAKKGAVGSTLMKILPKENIHKEYLYHFISSKFWTLNTKPKGVGIPHIEPTLLWNFELVVPPLPEQQAIVSKIEELLSELENGKQQLLIAQQQLKVYRQSLLNLLVTGKNHKTIESVIEKLDQGWSPKCLNENSQDENEWAVIKTSAIQHGHFVAYENKILPKDLKPREQHELKVGDILITRAGPRIRVGVCCMVRKTRRRLINCDKVYRIKVNTKIISPEYFELILNTPFYQREIEKMKSGISDSGLNLTQSKFLKIEIPIPSLSEQQLIVEELESKLTVCDKIEETISQSLQQAETLRQSILKRAFEGRLVAIIEEKQESKVIPFIIPDFPKKVEGISTTDLHAGIISMVIDIHKNNPKYSAKLSHVKCEKISDLVERKLGISLGRIAMKDAAGPDDFSHLKKVEHRAKMAGFFKPIAMEPIGFTYQPMRNIQKAIDKTKASLSVDELKQIDDLLNVFLPFELEHAELVATLYAGWNNLLLLGKYPTDEEIVFESRENWSKRKLTIDRTNFFKTLKWMKEHHYIPEGKGQMVLKKEEVKKINPKKTKPSKAK